MFFKKQNDDLIDSPITTEDENQESLKKASKWNEFQGRFKLGPHHKMERMAIMTGVLVTTLVFSTGVSFMVQQEHNHIQLTGKAVYTTQLSFSKSDHTGKVSNVYRSSDGKSAYILFKMDSVDDMSLDANNYKVFVSAFQDRLKFKPTGSFFIFGSTGYMGVELHDERGIPKQVLDITIRSTKDIREDASVAPSSGDNSDASFSKFDQARIYANPGGDKANVIKELNDSNVTSKDLYMTMIANPVDKATRKDIRASEAKLSRLLTRASEYTTRIKDAGYIAPSSPTWMDGDHMENGHFVTTHTVVGGFALDYENSTLKDGYVNQLVDSPSKLNDLLVKKNTEANDSTQTETIPSVKLIDATTKKELDPNADNSGLENINSITQSSSQLSSTWSAILQEKRNLQITLMLQLITNDYNTQTQSSSFSVSTGNHRIILWNQK